MKHNITGIELCEGCKYDTYKIWIKSKKDTCGVCIQGSEKRKTMTMDNFFTEFVEDLEFNVLIGWADVFSIDHEYKYLLDDYYPDKGSELRKQLVEAMLKVGK